MKLLSVLICLIFCTTSFAQQKQIDSLESLILIQKDKALANTYNELTWLYRSIDFNKALNYGNKAIALGNKINYLPTVAQAYNDIGILFFDKEKFDTSIHLYEKSMLIRQKLNDDLGIAKCYNKIGIIYQKKAEYEKALDAQYKALIGFEKANYHFGTSNALNNIAILHQNLRKYDKALEYHLRGLEIREKINDKQGIVQSYNNIGNVNIFLDKLNIAKPFYFKAIKLAKQINYNEGLAAASNNLASIYIKQDSFNIATNYIKEGLVIRQKQNDTKGIISSLNNLADNYIRLNQKDSALVVLKQTVLIAEKASIFKDDLKGVYQLLSNLYETLNEKEDALIYYKKYAAIKDSIFSDGVEKKFTEQETKYNTLKKEQTIQSQQLAISKNLYQLTQQELALSGANLQLAEDSLQLLTQNETILQNNLDASAKQAKINTLNKEALQQKISLQKKQLAINQKNTTIGVVAAASFIILLVGYGFYRKKQLQQQALFATEQAKQREQLTKAVIEAEEAERKRIASDLHDGVGQLFSAVKMNLNGLLDRIEIPKEADKFLAEKTLALVDESCKEVRVISHKMMPNFLLKSGIASDIRSFIEKIDEHTLKINFETKGFKEQLEFNEEVILYRVIQELINNVIKHAGANELLLQLERTEKYIKVVVADNGKGFNYEVAKAKGGLGLKNILVRIEYLKGSINFIPNTPAGTTVNIHIPIA